MKTRLFLLTAIAGLLGIGNASAEKYVGGDISMLPDFEKAGATYYSNTGTKINDLITYSYDQGMNAMRVRIFVDPDKFISDNLAKIKSNQDNYYLARANQSYEFILPLCKRIKSAGHKLLLDFHYSDTWADPAKQWTPADWASLSDEQLYTQIYEYTKDVLTKLKAAGAEPDFIQTGNEISYGMCWGPYGTSDQNRVYPGPSNDDPNLKRFENLLKNATKACRDVCPNAKIILHNERTAKEKTNLLTNFYDWAKNNIDFDIIGLSYYPYFHGKTSDLNTVLTVLDNKKYGKDIWIVETGCYINWAMGDEDKRYYEATDAGQNQFMTDLLEVLDKHSSVTGLFWWEMDYNAKGANTSGDYFYINNWYNASLFDNNTGKATSAFYTLAGWSGYVADDSNQGNDNENVTGSDFYLLYNSGGEWKVPGDKFEVAADGTYQLKNIHIYKDGEDYGWFAITTTTDTNWDVIKANQYGPITNNEDPLASGVSVVESNNNSWQVKPGYYDLSFDASTMLLNVKEAGKDEEVVDPTPSEPDEDEDKGDSNNKEEQEQPGGDNETENPEPPGDDNETENPDQPGDDNETEQPDQPGDDNETEQPDQPGDDTETEQPDQPGDDSETEQPGQPGEDYEEELPGDDTEIDDNPSIDDSGDSGDSEDNPDDAGVGSIMEDESEVMYFNLRGLRVQNPERGLYIKVVKGKTEKVYLR